MFIIALLQFWIRYHQKFLSNFRSGRQSDKVPQKVDNLPLLQKIFLVFWAERDVKFVHKIELRHSFR